MAENYDQQNAAVIRKWERRHQSNEEMFNGARNNLKKYIRQAIADLDTNRNIKLDMKDALSDASRHSRTGNVSGYNVLERDEVPTGFEPLPWADDDY